MAAHNPLQLCRLRGSTWINNQLHRMGSEFTGRQSLLAPEWFARVPCQVVGLLNHPQPSVRIRLFLPWIDSGWSAPSIYGWEISAAQLHTAPFWMIFQPCWSTPEGISLYPWHPWSEVAGILPAAYVLFIALMAKSQGGVKPVKRWLKTLGFQLNWVEDPSWLR